MHIVLDTNSVMADLTLKGPAIKKLTQKATEQGYEICFPEVVLHEMNKHFKENAEKTLKDLRRSAKMFDDLLGGEILDSAKLKKCESAQKKYLKTVRETIKGFGGIILPEPSISKRELMDKAVNRTKLFEEKGKGYQDALIWASIRDLAEQFSEVHDLSEPRIIFVTNNTGDFCRSGSLDIHEDLVEELEEIGANPIVVKVVKSLNDASALLVTHSDDIICRDAMSLLTGPRFKDSVIRSELEGKILDKLPYTSLDNVEAGLPDIFESPSIDMVNEDYTYDNIVVEPLANGEIAIELNVRVTCLIDTYVEKSEAINVKENDGLSIYDHDWNNYYVAGQVERGIWFKVNFITDKNFKAISSFEIEPDEGLNSSQD